MIPAYQLFLERKSQVGSRDGFRPTFMPGQLFGFQGALLDWAIWQGRAATLADCGLGKTLIELVWAENVVRHTNGRVLVLNPLAVSHQTVREGEKFGVEVQRSSSGVYRNDSRIIVTNYERLHRFDPADFAGVVCDESSILKSFDGVLRAQITEFMRKIRFRLLATATAAPNDYTELGTSSEALGYLGHVDMLNRFFKNDLNNSSTGRGYLGKANAWRFKGHAEEPFWRWVCSWARAIRRPSDLGFSDDGFVLPPLVEREHVVQANTVPDGMLFALPAADLHEQRAERRRTIRERCEKVAELVDHDRPALVWCHLNAEADLLEQLVPGAVQVSGADRDEVKEERLLAFQDGEVRALVTKPTIGAWGLNFQHCAHVTFFPSHSFEQYYQGVRRCWRFGQPHQGFHWIAEYQVWKEPLGVRNRTMAKNLAHRTIVEDSSRCSNASADQLLVFRRHGTNPMPIAHPTGLLEYAGARQMPAELLRYRNWGGKQTENRYSHWIWRQYASAFWDDVRLDRVLPYREARAEEDEKHVHPLQLDVIERAVVLWTNPGETVLTPFMGVGSEVYVPLRLGRMGIGIELKPSYYRQAVKNVGAADAPEPEQVALFEETTESTDEDGADTASVA